MTKPPGAPGVLWGEGPCSEGPFLELPGPLHPPVVIQISFCVLYFGDLLLGSPAVYVP